MFQLLGLPLIYCGIDFGTMIFIFLKVVTNEKGGAVGDVLTIIC
jgi:hypothetical protein